MLVVQTHVMQNNTIIINYYSILDITINLITYLYRSILTWHLPHMQIFHPVSAAMWLVKMASKYGILIVAP